jgi:hypothetical protein
MAFALLTNPHEAKFLAAFLLRRRRNEAAEGDTDATNARTNLALHEGNMWRANSGHREQRLRGRRRFQSSVFLRQLYEEALLKTATSML